MNEKSLYHVILLVLQIYICCAIYTDCGSKMGKITTIEIEGCDKNAPVCILHRNTNVTFQLSFNLTEDVENVTAVVHAIVFHAPVPFNLPNPNGCESGLTCPLKPGGPYTYEASLPVLKKYPAISIDVKWELQNELEEDIVCVLIPARVS